MSSKFIWYELMTSDTEAAQKFYGEVVGWGAQDAGGGMNYTLFTTGGQPVAGLMAIPENACEAGSKPGWIGYVAADDVDAMAERIKAEGGGVARAPEDIPGVGRFAVVTDPQGAFFCIMRGIGEAPPIPPHGTPGHAGWRELHAGDREQAVAFYTKLFGWSLPDKVDMGPMGTYQIFMSDEAQGGGMMTKMPQSPQPFWLYYFNVGDIDAAVARIGKAGGQVMNGPMEVPGGDWIAQGFDPQGAMFAVVGKKVQ